MESTPETAAGAPATDAPEDDELREAKELVGLFLKALKAFRLYLPNNRTLVTFVDAFYDALTRFLDQRGELCFRVNQFRIAYEGVPIYENAAKEESLAFRLFIHGVRELTFHPGVSVEEVSGFLQVINRAFDVKTSVDDLLSLLWEKDLRFITFIILDDFFEEGEQAEFDEFVEDGRRADATAGSMRATMQPLLDRLLNRTGEVEVLDFPEIFELTEEEVERISGWIEEESERDLIRDLCAVLLDFVDPGADESETREILQVIERVLEALLTDGKFTEAMRILRELREYGDGGERDCAVREMAREALEEIGADRMVRFVAPHVPSAHGERREFLIDFLSTLDQTAVPVLIDLLEKPETKEFGLQVLKRMADRHFSIFVVRLKDPRRSVVVSIVRLLAEIGDSRAITPLRDVLAHEDPAIRREAILAIGKIGSTDVLDLIRPALSDSEQEIRIAAVRALSGLPAPSVRPALLDMACARDFSRRSYFEKKEILLALAAVANAEVEDWLVSVARKRSWIRREERDELRSCAVIALARIGTGAALEAVRTCAQDRSPQVRRAAAQAIR